MPFEIEKRTLIKYTEEKYVHEAVVPEGVRTIGNHAFSGCRHMTSIVLPEGLKKIGTCAFANCYALQSINIPDSVTHIEDGAFAGCKRLASVVIPEKTKKIGRAIFSGTDFLKRTLHEQPYLIVNGRLLLAGGRWCEGTVNIPEGVTSIEDQAFDGCDKLLGVTIPQSVVSIGRDSFRGCRSLTSVRVAGCCDTWGLDFSRDFNGLRTIRDAVRMVREKDFSISIPSEVKLFFVWGMYRCTRDKDARTYLRRRIDSFVHLLLDRRNLDMIQILCDEDFFTKAGIDKCLQLAAEQEQFEAYTILLQHKEDKVGFRDIESRFQL